MVLILVLVESPVMIAEVVTTIKTKAKTFTNSYEEEAAAMESALSWTSTNTNHLSISVLFGQRVSPCVKLSFHPILEHFQSTIPSTPYHLLSLFNGSLAILPFQVTI